MEQAFARFVEAGFAAVSMQQIADAAGVTKATLYHHFQDKEDLFYEVMRINSLRSQEKLGQTVTRDQPLRQQLVAFGSYLFSTERADLNRLFMDLHQHVSEQRQEAFWGTFERPWTFLETPLAEAMERGEIAQGDPELIARVAFSAFAGQMQIARLSTDIPYPTSTLAERIVDMLLDGLRPR